MIKSKLNYKLINTFIMCLVLFLVYQTKDMWYLVIDKLLGVFIPLGGAFVIAYALYIFTLRLRAKRVPKVLSILLILLVLFGSFLLLFVIIFPLLFKQVGNVINIISYLSNKYSIDLEIVKEILIRIVKKYSNNVFNIISVSFSYITSIIVMIFLSIYFLFQMDDIRITLKDFFKKRGDSVFLYIKRLDDAIKCYLYAFIEIVFITFFEYSLGFILIRHPDFVLLGFMTAIGSVIPCFGCLIVDILALVTSYTYSKKLFIRCLILLLILSLIDTYVINPYVYGKSNKIPSIIVIISVFVFGSLFGFLGTLFAIPITIIIMVTFNYYRGN